MIFFISEWSGATPYLINPNGTGYFSNMSTLQLGKCFIKDFKVKNPAGPLPTTANLNTII
jgi:hypothetical protein